MMTLAVALVVGVTAFSCPPSKTWAVKSDRDFKSKVPLGFKSGRRRFIE